MKKSDFITLITGSKLMPYQKYFLERVANMPSSINKKIIVYRDGEKFMEYDSISSITNILGIKREDIIKDLKNSKIAKKGYSFKYMDTVFCKKK